ncbi:MULTISPECIES: DUF6975 family protein [Sphingobium]|uniref:DUF6975 family protein n=1 Tax=Sphingobium TaxID=165695 RepID=UPI0015ECBC80|nr:MULTISPECIES: hypothetical protein [Sphingobium]MCW2350142.1 hypothetical protein [Sphingobium sp. B12D2B]MCW2361502.1 hypothetical protein [Sphingobium sp. B10D3B]MCW2382052.1 hypothetical protein [Sphingobium sp. B2D3B]MCW2394285.1 hypothetical protein [Sphingobium sp. B8D3B]MCW2397768.1 hypothetical protein [Sphingobium sp. B2D3C]
MDPRPLDFVETGLSARVLALVESEGSATHSYCAPVLAGERISFARHSADFADFIHLLVLLHGQIPGVVDHAAVHTAEPVARDWLIRSTSAFAEERDYMHRLCAAAGPVPSTPRHSEATAAIAQQSHAIEMLAQSERRGCALGTAITLVLEWQAIRKILDVGALSLGIEPAETTLPSQSDTVALLDDLPQVERFSRAVQFGADQLLVQHRGMWNLLKARAGARQSSQ